MKHLTGKQRLYAAILGLGLIALVLDRTVFAPAPASGDLRPAPNVQQATATPTPDQPATTPDGPSDATTMAVADQLRSIAAQRGIDPTAIADAFRPSATWLDDNGVKPGTKTLDQIAQEFKASYRLTGIVNNPNSSFALVEDQKGSRTVVTVGDTLATFKLIAVDDRSAIFERGSIRIALTLPTPDLKGPPSP